MLDCRMSRTIRFAAFCVAAALVVQHPSLTAFREQKETTRTVRLFLLGHEIGAERSTIGRSGPASTLTSHFEYKDRGLSVGLDATLTYRDDYSPVSYTVHGR